MPRPCVGHNATVLPLGGYPAETTMVGKKPRVSILGTTQRLLTILDKSHGTTATTGITIGVLKLPVVEWD